MLFAPTSFFLEKFSVYRYMVWYNRGTLLTNSLKSYLNR